MSGFTAVLLVVVSSGAVHAADPPDPRPRTTCASGCEIQYECHVDHLDLHYHGGDKCGERKDRPKDPPGTCDAYKADWDGRTTLEQECMSAGDCCQIAGSDETNDDCKMKASDKCKDVSDKPTAPPPNFLLGFLLTLVAGMATVVGMAFIPLTESGLTTRKKATAASLAFAAGVMMWLSFIDLTAGAALLLFGRYFEEDHGDHVHTNEFAVRVWTAFWFFVGLVFTVLIDIFIGQCLGTHAHSHGGSDHEIQLTDAEAKGNQAVAAPADDEGVDAEVLKRLSFVTLIALAMHNFPEGLACFFSGATLELNVMVAIAMHNIPEGAAIAVPIYQSTKSFGRAFAMTFLAGLAQPAGAAIGWAVILMMKVERPTEFVYGSIYAATGGVMVAVSLIGLLPEAFAASSPRFCMFWISCGFLAIEISIILLQQAGGHSHGGVPHLL